jgi:hypothetical protein
VDDSELNVEGDEELVSY